MLGWVSIPIPMRSKLNNGVAIARWLILAIVVLHAPARAADFRTSDFGKPCAGLAEREAALGSEPIQWRKVSPHLHAFQAVVFGHETSVVYLCTNGLLRTGNYFFSKQNKADALKTLRAVYDGMVSTYGVPSLDRTPWQYGEAEINLIGSQTNPNATARAGSCPRSVPASI
jgi:hypothetical protein